MKIKLLLLSLLLSGCFHSDDSNESKNDCINTEHEFSGCWHSQVCEQAKDSDGNLVNSWLKSQYNFKTSGILDVSGFQYRDSSCSGEKELITSGENVKPEITYVVIGADTNSDGIEGIEIGITLKTPQETLSMSGLLIVTEQNELCSSETFNFGSSSFGISQAGFEEKVNIYENCLVKGQLP